MHRIFDISEIVHYIVEYHASIYGKRSLLPLVYVKIFSSAALDILWKDVGLLKLQGLPEFCWEHLQGDPPIQALENVHVAQTSVGSIEHSSWHQKYSKRVFSIFFPLGAKTPKDVQPSNDLVLAEPFSLAQTTSRNYAIRIKTVLPIFNLHHRFTDMTKSLLESPWYLPLTLYCVAGTADVNERRRLSDTWINLVTPTLTELNLYVEQDQPFSWGSLIPHLPPQLQRFGILPMLPINKDPEPAPAISYHDVRLLCDNLVSRGAYLQTLDLRFLHRDEVPYVLGMLRSLPKLKVLRLTSPRFMKDLYDIDEGISSKTPEATFFHSSEPWVALEDLFVRDYSLGLIAGILKTCSSSTLRSFVFTNPHEQASQVCSLRDVVGLLAEKWPNTLLRLSFEGETTRGDDAIADAEQIVSDLGRITSLRHLEVKSDHIMNNCHGGHHTTLRANLPNLSVYDIPTRE
ncbi:hypothetical protein CPB86DRAFT_786062 [Serendipita vermifera]|nr:hypothetical protein CPB86DRAFT_786062 [Serendipita vermifera]